MLIYHLCLCLQLMKTIFACLSLKPHNFFFLLDDLSCSSSTWRTLNSALIWWNVLVFAPFSFYTVASFSFEKVLPQVWLLLILLPGSLRKFLGAPLQESFIHNLGLCKPYLRDAGLPFYTKISPALPGWDYICNSYLVRLCWKKIALQLVPRDYITLE